MEPGFYAYLDISLEEQCAELRDHFRTLGASSIPEEPGSLEEDLGHIIDSCHLCFQESKEYEMEAALNSISSVLICIEIDKIESLVRKYCKKLSQEQSTKLEISCLKVLYLLYQGLPATSHLRYEVYCQLVPLSGRTDQIMSVFTDIPTLKTSFVHAQLSTGQMQQLYRLIHESLLKCKESERAAKVIMELLGTYTPENASQAKEDAHRCITSALADPATFLLDPLLALPPVKVLEGQPIHELLTIFVADQLPNYLTFYKEHKEFVDALGLSHQENIKKMRFLTFMQMAEVKEAISFAEVEEHMQIGANEVEEFVLDVLKTKLVKARLDHLQKMVIVSATMYRTFGKMQWGNLKGTLSSWATQTQRVKDSLAAVTKLQGDLMGNKAVAELIA